MKALKALFLGLIFISGSIFINGASAQVAENQDQAKSKVYVYYFHTNSRCVTCRTVESEARMNVKELFGGEVAFSSVNLDEKAGEAKARELGVNSQSLLVVKGDEKIELTTQGFMYARTDPDKFRKIMKEKIQPLL